MPSGEEGRIGAYRSAPRLPCAEELAGRVKKLVQPEGVKGAGLAMLAGISMRSVATQHRWRSKLASHASSSQPWRVASSRRLALGGVPCEFLKAVGHEYESVVRPAEARVRPCQTRYRADEDGHVVVPSLPPLPYPPRSPGTMLGPWSSSLGTALARRVGELISPALPWPSPQAAAAANGRPASPTSEGATASWFGRRPVFRRESSILAWPPPVMLQLRGMRARVRPRAWGARSRGSAARVCVLLAWQAARAGGGAVRPDLVMPSLQRSACAR